MKAVLVSNGLVFRRTHDLVELAGLLRSAEIQLPVTLADLQRLNPFAVTIRYEDMDLVLVSLFEVNRVLEAVRQWLEEQIYTPSAD